MWCLNALSNKMQNIACIAPTFQLDAHEHTKEE